MMSVVKQILKLDEARVENMAGGKAASLGELLRGGFKVPNGFVITADDSGDIANLEASILEHFDTLGAQFVAVRSSAVNEDGSEAAWAGQLDTFLNIHRDGLLDNIRRCIASAGSARAQAYAAHNRVELGNVAVVVQAMVESDISGVAFSAHPVTESREHMVVEAGLGLGEGIVSGQVTPDSYIIDNESGKVTGSFVSTQTKKLVRGETGNTWQTLDPAITTPKLSDQQLAELVKTVRGIAELYGFPVDVEWAYADGMLYVLQARPITTLR